MATNVKRFTVELDSRELMLLVNGVESLKSGLQRSIGKEAMQEVREIRQKQVMELTTLSNKLSYGSKELV